MAEERKHALLSASSAKRWINCPPSARLSEAFPESTSDYAEEGTLAHDICELKLRKLFIEPGMPEKTFKTAHNQLKKRGQYDPEMERYTDEYVDYIQKIAYSYPVPPKIVIEKEVHYGHVARDGYGFSDCIILSGTDCHVVDFKYGKGITVSAEENPQMMLYGLGALELFDAIYDIDTVRMTIYQPRLESVSTWEIPVSDLMEWVETELKPKAQLALHGEGEFHCGSWCRFCKAKNTCRARAEEYLRLAQMEFKPPALLSDEEIAEVLKVADELARWSADVYAFATNEAITHGKKWTGFKLVEGRSNRKYTDEEEVAEAAKAAGYTDIYKKSLVGITEMEKLMGKKKFAEVLGKLVYKPQGKITLVTESDKRQEIQTATAEADFKEENYSNPINYCT